MRVAAIDLGSASAKLLVVEGTTELDRRIGVSLGKGVGADGTIPKTNQARAIAALTHFITTAGVPAQEIDLVATAAVRNAPNQGVLMRRIHDLGLVRARVLSGGEEAALAYRGALIGRPHGAYAVLDLGGGS